MSGNEDSNKYIEYIRDEQYAPIGTLVAYLDDTNNIVIGFSSKCKQDKLDKKRGRTIAIGRAKKLKSFTTLFGVKPNTLIKYDYNPHPKYIQRLALFIEKCKYRRSFQGKALPEWALKFSQSHGGENLHEQWEKIKYPIEGRQFRIREFLKNLQHRNNNLSGDTNVQKDC